MTAMESFGMNQVKRIAIPAVGTGNLKYSINGVATSMITGIYEHLSANPGSSIEEVLLVVYDDECYKVKYIK